MGQQGAGPSITGLVIVSTRLCLRRVHCKSGPHGTEGKGGRGGREHGTINKPKRFHLRQNAPDARVPANRKPPDKVLENRKCRDYNAAHFTGTNCSLNVLCASNWSVQTVRERNTPARGGEPLHPFWLMMRFALFSFWAQLLFLPSQDPGPSGREPDRALCCCGLRALQAERSRWEPSLPCCYAFCFKLLDEDYEKNTESCGRDELISKYTVTQVSVLQFGR